MISGHFTSFSSFMPILVLVEKVVLLFCALSGLIMSLPARITNKTSLSKEMTNIIKTLKSPGAKYCVGWSGD